MIYERSRLEREWIEARSELTALQHEVRLARRAAAADPALNPKEELLARLSQAKRRCADLQTIIMGMLDQEREKGIVQ